MTTLRGNLDSKYIPFLSPSNTVLYQVDNSAPSVGAFAVSTEHAVGHQRHRPGQWMTYTSDANDTSTMHLHLAWLGFGDPHSDVASYHVKVREKPQGVHCFLYSLKKHRCKDDGFCNDCAIF